MAHDSWSGWVAGLPSHLLHAYTDASLDAASRTSAWAVVIGDSWLAQRSGLLPTDEKKLLRVAHVARGTLIGAKCVPRQAFFLNCL